MMSQEARLVSLANAAPGHYEARDPCGPMQSVLLSNALETSSGFARGVGGNVDVSGMCSPLRPVVHAATEVYEWLSDPAMARDLLMSVVHVTTQDHVYICDLRCHLRPR